MFGRKKFSILLNKIEELSAKTQNIADTKINLLEEHYDKKIDELKEIISKSIIINEQMNQVNEQTNLKLNEIQQDLESKQINLKKFEYCNPEYLQLVSNNTDRKKILLIGFYGAYNLGDELMLHSLLNFFKKYSNIELTVMLANNFKYNIFSYENIKFIHYPQTPFDFECLSNYYDCFIYGGGAILDDTQYNIQYPNEVSLATTVIELSQKAQEKQKQTFFIGLSTNNKFKNKEYIKKLKKVIENATYFSLRDKYGLKVLNENNIDTSKIEIIDDIVLTNDIKKSTKKKNKVINIGLILIGIDINLEKYNLTLIQELIDKLDKRKEKFKINLIPFYNYNEYDINYYKQLIQKVDSENIEVKPYVNTLQEIIEVFDTQDYIISMRYHGALLSLFMNKKTLTLVDDYHPHYMNKMNYLYEEYKFPKNLLIISKSNKDMLIEAIDKLLDDKTNQINTKPIIDRNKKKINKIIDEICKK